ncbi:MAG: hypothetical protein ABSC72_13940 [Methylovirgula sp.]|jgi:selenocysteine lyase/cysteine desulfurase
MRQQIQEEELDDFENGLRELVAARLEDWQTAEALAAAVKKDGADGARTFMERLAKELKDEIVARLKAERVARSATTKMS